jgi:hypothetical protein
VSHEASTNPRKGHLTKVQPPRGAMELYDLIYKMWVIEPSGSLYRGSCGALRPSRGGLHGLCNPPLIEVVVSLQPPPLCDLHASHERTAG